MFRQTLCGSPDQYYALISHNLTVRPSYFFSALLNQVLLGGSWAGREDIHVFRVLPQPNTGLSTTRVYGVCAHTGRALGLLIINLHLNSSSRVLVNVSGAAGSLRLNQTVDADMYTLTAPLLTSPELYLNGLKLGVDPSGNEVIQPPFHQVAKRVPAATSPTSLAVEVPPLSVSLLLTPLETDSRC